MSSSTFPAFVFTNDPDNSHRSVEQVSLDQIASDGVLIEVEWSSVNFKDGLASTTSGKISRLKPMIPGIDIAGTVVDAAGSDFVVGQKVIAHGYDIGVARHGGYAQFVRVPAEWIMKLPDGLTAREAMVVGTGGFTSALSIVALENWGLTPSSGPVLVTGATGGTAIPTSVMPFILRGVALLGIDSVQTPMDVRRNVWGRIASDLKPAGLESIGHSIGLNDLDRVLTAILAGEVSGRYVVSPTM